MCNGAEANPFSRRTTDGAARVRTPRRISRDAAKAYMAILISCGTASAQAVSSAAQLPPGRGRELVTRACSSCHSTARVIQHRDTVAGWTDEVDSMIARGAILSAPEESTVAAYLAQNYPSGTTPAVAGPRAKA